LRQAAFGLAPEIAAQAKNRDGDSQQDTADDRQNHAS
jgi:hypothetical protein